MHPQQVKAGIIEAYKAEQLGSRFRIGGVFDTSVTRHVEVQRSIEQNDPERESWARRHVFENGLYRCSRDLVKVDQETTHNLVPTVGLNFILNLLFYTTPKVTTWYHGPFTTNWTPTESAGGNWAGSTSGPLATELQPTQFTEANRQAAHFASAASNGSIAATTATQVTIASNVSGVTVYGTTLNDQQSCNYNQGDGVLLAATRFQNPKSGLGEADILNLSYTLTVSSV